MLEDFLLNLFASFTYDALKALLPHPPSQEAVLDELKNELRRQSEAFQAFQTVLSRFGAQAVVKVDGDVSGSVILLGNNNQVTVQDGGRLARGWLAWKGDPAEARRTYLEWLTARYARHIFPLSKLSFQVTMQQVYQPLMVAPYQGEWRPSLRFQARALPLDEAFASPSLYALTGLLGEGKSTALRYLAWVYAAQPEGHLLLGMGERLPFLTTVRHLYTAWQRTPDPLTAWAEAMAGEHPFLETALLRRVLQDALDSGNALLLLDALDEARLPAEARAAFLRSLSALPALPPWRGNALVLTSRPHDWLAGDFSTFAIQEMLPEAIALLAYRLGRALLDERRQQGFSRPTDPPPEETLDRLAHLAERAASGRFGTPFYVTLLVLAALRDLQLEHGLRQAESLDLRRLSGLYRFFLRQTLNWERSKPDADRGAFPDEETALRALAALAWESFPDPARRALLEPGLLSAAERAAALTFWERVGLLWRDELTSRIEFIHHGFELFGVALHLHLAGQDPALRPRVEALRRQTDSDREWADVWELFFGLSGD